MVFLKPPSHIRKQWAELGLGYFESQQVIYLINDL
jgi:hypothetical protein